ncbi:hypothetical protein A0H81_08892 [Grifola frondosa]|uniref:Uncharacterized protein n=1 Tax=Grifola frondosa TaxID=5627 RepID=A0A1C7M4A7_GRIFR|nr:hypothetical protein A0H81_08892 [Grifola frondosa]
MKTGSVVPITSIRMTCDSYSPRHWKPSNVSCRHPNSLTLIFAVISTRNTPRFSIDETHTNDMRPADPGSLVQESRDVFRNYWTILWHHGDDASARGGVPPAVLGWDHSSKSVTAARVQVTRMGRK